MFSELFAPVSIGVRTIAKTVRILERNHLQTVFDFDEIRRLVRADSYCLNKNKFEEAL